LRDLYDTLSEEAKKTVDSMRSDGQKKLDSYLNDGCVKCYNLDVIVEAVYPADKCLIVRAPDEIHVGDPAKYAFDLEGAIEAMKGTKYELSFSNETPAFWEWMMGTSGMPKTLRVFVYPPPKKTKWYKKQKPEQVRYVLFDNVRIPHFADF